MVTTITELIWVGKLNTFSFSFHLFFSMPEGVTSIWYILHPVVVQPDIYCFQDEQLYALKQILKLCGDSTILLCFNGIGCRQEHDLAIQICLWPAFSQFIQDRILHIVSFVFLYLIPFIANKEGTFV